MSVKFDLHEMLNQPAGCAVVVETLASLYDTAFGGKAFEIRAAFSEATAEKIQSRYQGNSD